MAGKFLSLEDAARQLGVSIDEVNRLVDRKKLFPMRDGATIKFKADDVERVGRSLGEESSLSGDLSLDLEMPDVAPALSAAGSLSGLDTDDIVVGDAIEAGESIFSVDAPDANAASQTLVRGDEALGSSAIAIGPASGLSMPSLGGASAADVVFGDSLVGEGPESEDLALESLVGGSSQLLSSSPSLATGSAASTPQSLVAPALSDASGTLAIDLSDVAGGPAGGSLVLGSGAALSGGSDGGAGLSLSGALDSGLSLEDGDIQMSGIDLGAMNEAGSGPLDGGTVLGGDDFELGGAAGDDESASVVIAEESETGDSSFFGQTMVSADGSSFSEESVASSSVASEALDLPFGGGREMTFSLLQTLGLICCSLLLLFGGFIAFDLVRTIGTTKGVAIATPLLDAMAGAFGWR
jgi:excisionase family DNA binding protein